jgi:hypothetical protein
MARQTGARGQNKKPWLTYDLKEDNINRDNGRKLLHISSMFKELGYPIRLISTGTSLRVDEKGLSIPGVTDKMMVDVGIIEFQKLEDKTTEEVIKLLEGKGVKVFVAQSYLYSDNTNVTRVFIQISTIKEGA